MEISKNSKNTAIQIIIKSTYLLFFLIMFSCEKESSEADLKTGIWRGEIIAQNNPIPFNFEIQKNQDLYKINLINGEEILEIDEVKVLGDSLFFDMHIFDISVKAKINDSILTGTYNKNYAENYTLPFKALYNKKGRFDQVQSNKNFDGTWETVFKSEDGNETPAIGIFKTKGNNLTGTFLLKTGDYRYLDGYTENNTMHLYTFDGNHIYKFKATKENDSLIKGQFWSGKTGYKTFIAKKNDHARLPDANGLTFLKEGFDKIDFSFPGLDGNPVSLNDEKYKNKVVILQILGTWCPNCMDETKFYKQWYDKNKHQDV
ncbi:MAG: TlpA family protein disulfide reductase, partial [Flavobacteriaceae bacterium]|nr:TlpA family protein disulfide reductase [Flavobacteriaceae bacterium]